jgi:diacylglycerol kinase (ATP)
MTGRKIIFVVNPNAGRRNSTNIIDIINREFPAAIEHEVVIWKDAGHFRDILSRICSGGYTDAVAVGGDGTVNQVAASIVGTDIALGIVPAGSGNGLARSLGVSMEIDESLRQIVTGKTMLIDSGTVNGKPFFCTSGVGFDSHIGNLFAASVKRGLRSYISITTRELLRYRAKTYLLKFNGTEIRRKAFLITVANAGQYGNDFYIAPQASMADGLFHVVVLKPFNVITIAPLLRRILTRKAFLSSSIETYTTDHLIIERESADYVHFDGEPATEPQRVEFRMNRSSLKAIVGTT